MSSARGSAEGFGPKAAVYPEYLVAAAACRALGAPVKWAETRSEDMVSLVQGRDYVMTAKLGVTKDGKFTGLEGDVTANAGSYPAIGAILPMLTQMMCVGVYDIQKVKFATRSVVTNTTTVGAYRGAGRPEATQLIERVIDVAARKIGMDPAEIRRTNFIQPGEFPLTTNTGAAYDSGEYEKALDAVLAASGYKELRAEQARRRAANDPIAMGIGLSTYVEVTAPVGLHIEFGAVEDPRRRHRQCVRRHQRARPGSPHGLRHAGHRGPGDPDGQDQAGQLRHRPRSPRRRNAWLAVPADRRLGDLRGVEGSAGSRPREIAAHLLEAAAEDIVAEGGSLHVAGTPSKSISWAELAVASKDPSQASRRPRPRGAPSRARLRRHQLDVPVRCARVGRRGRHRDRQGHHAPARRRRRLRANPQPAARRRSAARRDRPGRRPGDLRVGALRRRRQPGHGARSSTTPFRRPPNCPASRRRTPRPTARGTRSAPRASASPAPSARRRPSTTRSSTRCRTSVSTHIDMPCTPERVGRHSTPSRFREGLVPGRLTRTCGGLCERSERTAFLCCREQIADSPCRETSLTVG